MLKKKQAPIVDALQKRIAAGQRRIARKQAADRDKATKDEQKLQRQMRSRAKELFAECQKKAGKAADKGESQVLVNVMQWSDEQYPSWCRYLTNYTRELLEKAGFVVKIEHEKMEPVGSDPMFDRTAYSTNLHISFGQ